MTTNESALHLTSPSNAFKTVCGLEIKIPGGPETTTYNGAVTCSQCLDGRPAAPAPATIDRLTEWLDGQGIAHDVRPDWGGDHRPTVAGVPVDAVRRLLDLVEGMQQVGWARPGNVPTGWVLRTVGQLDSPDWHADDEVPAYVSRGRPSSP
jgi:hypothetical protein